MRASVGHSRQSASCYFSLKLHRELVHLLWTTRRKDSKRVYARRLRISLWHHRACNAALVKLVDQENLIPVWDERHGVPNTDVSHVAFIGHRIVLPNGLALSC